MIRSPLALLPRPGAIARAAASLLVVAWSLASIGQSPAPAATQPAVPAARQAHNIAVITIEGPIDTNTYLSVKRRLVIAQRAGADAIVIDLETPGGEVPACLAICTEIKACPIRNTVAWVHRTAFSGGAVIALACREMVTADPSTFGDALPILPLPMLFSQLPEHEQQKLLAALMAEVIDSARQNNYDEFLVQGLVSRGVELWLVQSKETGRTLFVNRHEYRLIFGEDPDGDAPAALSSATTGGTTAGDLPKEFKELAKYLRQMRGRPGQPLAPPASPSNDKRFVPAAPRLAPIDGEVTEIMEAKPLQTLQPLPPLSRPVITTADRGRWSLIEHISNGNGPFVFKADQLRRYSLAAATVNTDDELKAFFGAKNLLRLNPTWSEGLVAFMTSMPVRALLVVVFLVCLFVEMTHPGVVLPGTIAMLALVALVAPPLLIDLSAWWTAAAIFGGIALIGLEIFVIPGFGLPGVLGLLLLFGGLVGTFVPSGSLFPDTPGQRNDLLFGMATLLMAVATSGVIMYFLGKHFRSLPVFSRLVLQDPVLSDDQAGQEMLAAMAQAPVRPGMSGTAITPLRPAGRVQLGDRIIDVVSEVGYIPAGAPVKITSVSDFRVSVEPA